MTSHRITQTNIRLSGAIGSRILAAIFLFYLSPVMIAVALLVKLESNGPVLVRRRRCLTNTGPVDLWEFRTSVPADNGLFSGAEESGSVLGAFLQVSRLDLLPRLVNVVRGEVAFKSAFH